ncbi:MAG: M23 family metallopeptidase [Porphyromonadaceae bacterium]|nr:M23 family metallopeptidase [Porphyromonadaceae bacterium]
MRELLALFLTVVAILSAGAQSIDFDAIMRSANEASRQKAAAASQTFDGIISSMNSTLSLEQQSTSSTISGVADAMRSISSGGTAQTAQGDDGFYTGDINYSTYGSDTRQEIATQNATMRRNPFKMGDYTVDGTFATPGGRQYIHIGGEGGGYSGRFRLPVRGRVTSGYGYRPQFGRMHRGIDLALNTGDTVRSSYDGRVVLISNDPDGYGRYVKVKHSNGMETLYAHLSEPLVVSGQQVRAGQPLGLGGATGNATGPHLHFETRVNGTAVDPSAYFDFGTGRARQDARSPINDGGRTKSNQQQPSRKEGKKSESRKQPSAQQPKMSRPRLKVETIASAGNRNNGGKPRPGTYQVRRGDTLAGIARNYGMSVGEICRLNKMSKYTPMYPGKILRLK